MGRPSYTECMQRIAIVGLIFLLPLLTACGKFAEKFSRINGSYTAVHFDHRQNQILPATVDGGIMIYFIDQVDSSRGFSFGFSSNESVNTKPVLLPNGQYRVYAYGWDGASTLAGQTRCGKGSNGDLITLAGSSTTISLNLDPGNCQFGTANDFGVLYQGAVSDTNYDVMDVAFCTGAAYPSCSAASGGTFYVMAELLGGKKNATNSQTEFTDFTISACSAVSGTSSVATGIRLPIGGSSFSPPVRIKVFTNSVCSGTASGTYSFPDGIKGYLSVSSGSSYYVDVPVSSNSFILKLNKYF